MATYTELAGITDQAGFGGLQSKMRAAVVVKAVALLDQSTPTASQIAWAKTAIANPADVADGILWYVIGANASASVAQILAATDSAVQTNVNAAADKITSV